MFPTTVNSRITDAVTQSNVNVLGVAGAMAMGSIYQSSAHSMSIAFENAVQAQRQAAICAQAATNQGVIQLYSVGSTSAASATARIARSDTVHTAIILLKALKALGQI